MIVGATTEKSRFANIKLSLGTKRCLEMGELRVLDISEKSSKSTKKVGY